MSGIAVSDWVSLLKLGRQRFGSQADFVRFQAYQAGLSFLVLEAKGVRIAGRWALDLGCGDGAGRTDACAGGEPERLRRSPDRPGVIPERFGTVPGW